jgi:hypothetical protein
MFSYSNVKISFTTYSSYPLGYGERGCTLVLVKVSLYGVIIIIIINLIYF